MFIFNLKQTRQKSNSLLCCTRSMPKRAFCVMSALSTNGFRYKTIRETGTHSLAGIFLFEFHSRRNPQIGFWEMSIKTFGKNRGFKVLNFTIFSPIFTMIKPTIFLLISQNRSVAFALQLVYSCKFTHQTTEDPERSVFKSLFGLSKLFFV